jgi:uncharacterized protein involved in exopolysaccharide biosynthesis
MESLRPRRLTEFIAILWKRKKLLLLMSLVMLIATLIVIRRVPSVYESRALVIVNLRSDPESASEMNRFATLQQQLTSRETLASLIRKHGLYPKSDDLDDAVQAMQKSLKIETKMRNYAPEVPESVSINHRHVDPKKAQAVVNDLVAMLEQGNEQIKIEATAEAGRLDGQIGEVESRLKALSPMRAAGMVGTGADSGARPDFAAIRSQRQMVESSIEGLSDTEFAQQNQIAEQRAQLAEHEKLVRSLPAAPGSAAYGALLTEKSRIEAEIHSHSDQYTDKHPKMIQLRNQLAEINRQIDRLETQQAPALPTLLTPEGRELLTMRRDLKKMETDLEVTQRQLQRRRMQEGKLPLDTGADDSGGATVAATDEAARTEYERLLLRYNWLLEKQDSILKLSGAQGPSHMMFYVIDTPNLPRLPVAPNRFTLQIFALGLAIAFGLFIALAVELPRMFKVNDDRDVEYLLGAPVLALIPETLTPIERARKRKLRLTRGLLVLSLAVALAPILVMLLTYLKIFQIVGGK